MHCCNEYEELQRTFDTVSNSAMRGCVEGDYMGVEIKGNTLTIDFVEENPSSGDNKYADFELNFCPFCGTKL